MHHRYDLIKIKTLGTYLDTKNYKSLSNLVFVFALNIVTKIQIIRYVPTHIIVWIIETKILCSLKNYHDKYTYLNVFLLLLNECKFVQREIKKDTDLRHPIVHKPVKKRANKNNSFVAQTVTIASV